MSSYLTAKQIRSRPKQFFSFTREEVAQLRANLKARIASFNEVLGPPD
jgi:hypothetical protein